MKRGTEEKKYDESVEEEELMASSKRQTFSEFGPPPISSFDWNNLYHRTSSLSCLVQGVYTMERDRQKKVGLNSQAKDWWERVDGGFTLEKQLTDKKDDSIYGAVFKKDKSHQQNTPNSAVVVAPQYVIAFRGTIIKKKTVACDLKNNIRFFFENLHRGKRFVHIIQTIQNYVETHGNTSVWIAGHSLGAGLALLAGKTMARSGFPVEAYIFNPPSSLIPLEQLVKHNENLKCTVRIARDIVKAGITITTAALVHNEFQEDHSLMNLASWKPHLFVNRLDPICSEYIGHFHYKVQMSKLGLGWVERLAAKCSVRSMLFGGEESSSSNSSPQHLHFLPSAIMIENKMEPPDFHTKHGIHQWWNPMLQDQSTYTLYS